VQAQRRQLSRFEARDQPGVDGQGIELDSVSEGRYAYFIDRAYRVNDQDWGVFSLDRLARTPEFRQAAA